MVPHKSIGIMGKGLEYFHDNRSNYYALSRAENMLSSVPIFASRSSGVPTGSNVLNFPANGKSIGENRYAMTSEGWLIDVSFNHSTLQLQYLKTSLKEESRWNKSILSLPKNAVLCDVSIDTFNVNWSLYPEVLTLYTYSLHDWYFIGATMVSDLGSLKQKNYMVDIPKIQSEIATESCPTLTTFLYNEKTDNDYKVAVYFNTLNLKQLKPDTILKGLKFVPEYKPSKEDITTYASDGQSFATLRSKAQAGYWSNYRLFVVLSESLSFDINNMREEELPSKQQVYDELILLLGEYTAPSTLEELRSKFIIYLNVKINTIDS